MSCLGGRKFITVLILFIALTGLRSIAHADAAPYVWIEGEKPTTTNVPPNLNGWGHKEFLSGGAWLTYNVAPDQIAKVVPADGILVSYSFTAPADGKYTVWDRMTWDSISSPFDWRVDGGQWATVPKLPPTIDLMDVDIFCEVSWLNLGQAQLTKGDHKIEFRALPQKDKTGAVQNIVFGIDAICLSQGNWQPFSHFKPDENSQADADVAAGKNVFTLPEAAAAGQRSSVPLKGAWEFARTSEDWNDKVAEPLKLETLPPSPHWMAIDVPSNKNDRPDLIMAHRFVYRTHVSIPASGAGHSFFLSFPLNNLNTTVYCNGVYCGFNKNPLAPISIDITAGAKPGQVNEIEVAMRDAWYAYENDANDPAWQVHFRMPTQLMDGGFQHMIYPVWSYLQSGILSAPVLTMAGSAYTSDVFVKPSVAKHELAAEVTVENPSAKPIDAQVVCEAIDVKTGKTEKTLPATQITLAPGQEQVVKVADAWANPTLWWPDDPHLYTLRATVQVGGQPVDTFDQRFGFREWSIDGIHFKLNGVVYHAWQDTHTGNTPAEWLAMQRKYHETVMRLWHSTWMGLSQEEALNFMDENGVPVRRSETLDGEGMGYQPLPDLVPNWRDQLLQNIKSERNHPSLMLYSIENEFLYINLMNLGACDTWEPLMAPVAQAVEKFDPTHPLMVDGGGAMKDELLPVHGSHYINGDLTQYPALAYDSNVNGGGRGRWVWDMKRPRYVGEDWFLAGNHPELATVGGEAALAGKSSSLGAAGRMIDICQQGYRWADYGGWAFWMTETDSDGSYYNAMNPRAVLCRQWDWTFPSGAAVPRTLGIFNDTEHADPMTFTWSLMMGGKQVATDTSQHNVAPGTREVFDIKLPMPTVTTRTEGQWILSLTAAGQEVFKDTKDVSVLPAVAAAPPVAAAPVAGGDVSPATIATMGPGKLVVYDPAKTVVAFLKQRNILFTELPDLKNLPADAKVLLIGKDALTAEDSTSSRFAAWADEGRCVVALEQANPLKYQALPAQMEPAKNEGRVAFVEDLGSPLAKGLAQKDFFTWGPDEIVYRNAYNKPGQGARSLVECDALLQNSALIEVPVGKGVMMLSQLVLEEKLANNAVAQQLLANLVNFGSSYTLETRPVTLTTPAGSEFAAATAAVGVEYKAAADPLAAIAEPGEKIAMITASPENLAALAANQPKVDAFTAAGGWILFNDLTPEGLASYNKIVGVEHLIRPYGGTPSLTNLGARKVERVLFSQPRDPLSAGIALGDIVQYSSQPMFGYQSGDFVSSDEFSYIVDYDEVAPFCTSPFPHYGNITNGFTNADGWPLIINDPVNADGSPSNIDIKLPRPETITEFTWIGNKNYYPVTKVNLLFDGKPDGMASFDVRSDSSPMTFPINPPRKASSITLQIAAWTVVPNVGSNWGIDNIYFKVQRSPDFLAKVKPMLNIGGMMEYPRGKGGMVLCNLAFKSAEEVPANVVKKRSILAALLRNLNAPFAGKTVIVGAHLNYSPIDISKQANQYRTDRGWFGDKNFTFAALPTGSQNLNGVQYDIYDFPTSPVPTAIMLGAPGIPNNPADHVDGIPVNRKADALFFLQTARIDQPMSADEIQRNLKLELFKYVVHYADGQTADVPVYEGADVDNYRLPQPAALPGAALAWSSEYEKTGSSAAAWTKQWNNPRPDVEITSIDVAYGPDKRAVPAVLAITAATAQQ